MKEEKTISVEESLKTAGIASKGMLTLDETAKYLGMSKGYLYKLTHTRMIPFYKPLGKMCYFKREELEEWLQSNRIPTLNEMSVQVSIKDIL